jgi:2-polyprenyl-6-methoxyphenol hydroxylase-like FAD-dependent oxidoreductase
MQLPGMLGPYTVDRTTFRQLLTTGIEPHIQFGKELKNFEETPDGVIAHFTDGTSAEGSLLIGADGIRSAVRRQHSPNLEILDGDSRFIYGKTPYTPELETAFPEFARKHITLIKDSRPVMLFLEPVRWDQDPNITSEGKITSAKDYIYWVLGWTRDQYPVPDSELFGLSHPEIFQLCLKLTESWDPPLRAVLEQQAQDLSSAVRNTSIAPSMPAWEPNPGVVLIGDAIHPMIPAAASGANTALKDAAGLVETIVKDWKENDGTVKKESIAAFEEKMREYASKAVEMGWMGGHHIYGQKNWKECEPIVV